MVQRVLVLFFAADARYDNGVFDDCDDDDDDDDDIQTVFCKDYVSPCNEL